MECSFREVFQDKDYNFIYIVSPIKIKKKTSMRKDDPNTSRDDLFEIIYDDQSNLKDEKVKLKNLDFSKKPEKRRRLEFKWV